MDKPSRGLNIYTCLQQRYLLSNSNTVRQKRNGIAERIVKHRGQAAEFICGDRAVRSCFISFLIYYKYSRWCKPSCILINRFRLTERKGINRHSSICSKSQDPRQFLQRTQQRRQQEEATCRADNKNSDVTALIPLRKHGKEKVWWWEKRKARTKTKKYSCTLAGSYSGVQQTGGEKNLFSTTGLWHDNGIIFISEV